MRELEYEMLNEVDTFETIQTIGTKPMDKGDIGKFNRVAIDKIVEIVKNGGGEYLQPKVKVSTLSDIPKGQVRDVEL